MKNYFFILFLFLTFFKINAQKDSLQKKIDSLEAKLLKEVTVENKKKLFERKVDRLVFNVENSIQATGGDAIDALKVTPGIRVENDKISMIGKSGMSVMIDDRMIQLSGEDLINYLRSIPSDNIKSIEVITTPPAKYEAQGNSGIINIQLKKAKKDSWNASLRSSYTQVTYPSGNIGGTFSYQKNKWEFMIDLSTGKRKNIYENDQTYLYPNQEYWESLIKNINRQDYISPTLDLSYKINKKLKIGFRYNLNIITKKSDEINKIKIYKNSLKEDFFKFYDTKGYKNTNDYKYDLNFNLTKKLDTLGKKITLDVDYFINSNNKDNPFYTTNYYYEVFKQDDFFVSNISDFKIQNFSTRIDFELPYKWANLNFGAKVSFTKNNSKVEGNFYEIKNEIYDKYLSQKNDFEYKENNEALYFSLDKTYKKLTIKAGLRMESTQNQGNTFLISQGISSDSLNKKDYIKLFPTAYLAYKLNDNHTFGIDYARRINRPAYWELNPAKWYININTYVQENPFLQPSFADNYSLKYSYKSIYNNELGFSNQKNAWGQLVFIESDKTIKMIRENYNNSKIFYWDHYFNFNPIKKINTNFSLSIWYMETNTFNTFIKPKYSGWGAYFSTNNSFKMNDKLSLELNYYINFPGKNIETSTGLGYSLDSGFKYFMLDKKLQISFLFNDILKTSIIEYKNSEQNINKSFKQYYDTQYIRLSINYKFGNSKINIQKREGSNQEEQKRAN